MLSAADEVHQYDDVKVHLFFEQQMKSSSLLSSVFVLSAAGEVYQNDVIVHLCCQEEMMSTSMMSKCICVVSNS